MKGKAAVHGSGGSNEWTTPSFLFDYFNKMYEFNLDIAASDENHLCDRYFTEHDSALTQHWGADFRAWNNPPYSGGNIQFKFIYWTILQHKLHFNTLSLHLIPARTETKIWQEFVWPCASKIWFPDERIHFSYAPTGAGFPSAFVLFTDQTVLHPGFGKVQAEVYQLELSKLPGYKEYKDKIKSTPEYEEYKKRAKERRRLELNLDGKTREEGSPGLFTGTDSSSHWVGSNPPPESS